MGHTSKKIKDRGAKCYLHCLRLTQEIIKNNFSMLPRDHSCDILVKNVINF